LAHFAHLPVPIISLLHLGHLIMSAQGIVALHLGHLQETDAQVISFPQPGHFMVLPLTPMASWQEVSLPQPGHFIIASPVLIAALHFGHLEVMSADLMRLPQPLHFIIISRQQMLIPQPAHFFPPSAQGAALPGA
jgi:hypothetical protein